jgi:predicted N-acetyltransferase YhbS
MVLQVRQLRETDDRKAFRSGHPDLDLFFQRFAGQNQFKLHIGSTYVAVDDAGVILGFMTVASCSIELSEVPPKKLAKRLPNYPIPALRLARMAVADGQQRAGLGRALMKAVFLLARDQARKTGCAFVVVDAKAGAESYYEQFGFEALPVEAGELEAKPTPTPMFLELGAIPDTDEAIPGA